MRKIAFIIIVAIVLGSFITVSAQTNSSASEIHIAKDGKVTLKNLKVMQFAGTTIYTRPYWGDAFLRLTVKTNPSTKFIRQYGEVISLTNIKEGNYIDVEGILEAGSETLNIMATQIKNLSDQKEMIKVSGTITAMATSTASNFILKTKEKLIELVILPTAEIIKGTRTLDSSYIKVGDRVASISGIYDHATNVLQTEKIKITINMNIYKPQNFQGVLKILPDQNLPTTMIVKIGSIEYTVNLDTTTKVINKLRKNVSLKRFDIGDSIRIYGAIQETDSPIINAKIVRNISI